MQGFDGLVKVNAFNGEKLNSVDARELHKTLESKKHYNDWIKEKLASAGLEQGVDFIQVHHSVNFNGVAVMTVILTLDSAKSIAMLERTETGKKVRAYFIECEKKVQQFMLPDFTNPAVAARAWAEQYEAKTLALAEASKANGIVTSLIVQRDHTSFTKAFKELGLKPRKALEHLREKNILNLDNTPTSYQMKTGRFVVREHLCQDGKYRPQTFVTGDGLVWFQGFQWPTECAE